MKKILSFLLTAAMTIPCIIMPVHAEGEISLMSVEASGKTGSGIELMALPVEEIYSSGLTQDEVSEIKAAIEEALNDQENHYYEDEGVTNENIVEVIIPDTISKIPARDNDGQITAKAHAALGVAENYISDHPEYFYFENSVSATIYSDNSIHSLTFEYCYNKEERESIQTDIDKKAEEIHDTMKADGLKINAKFGDEGYTEQDDFDKALWLHDYLANTITYDERAINTEDNPHTPEEQAQIKRGIDAALIDGLTVCEGYSEAYKYLLESVGVECVNVYSDTERHEWSAVKIGGKWYYVDTTQDDPVPDTKSRVMHDFFLVTEDELLGSGTHRDGYITEIELVNDDFGAEYEGKPWHGHYVEIPSSEPIWDEGDIQTKVVFNGDERYYAGFVREEGQIKAHSSVFKCDAGLENAAEFCAVPDGIWNVKKASDGMEYSVHSYYGGIDKYIYSGNGERCLYFNSQTDIYEINLDKSSEDGVEIVPKSILNQPTEDVISETGDGGRRGIHSIYIEGLELKYETETMFIGDNGGISIGNAEVESYKLANTVELYSGLEDSDKLIDKFTVRTGEKIKVPEYYKYGYVITGWTTDKAGETAWDFDTPVTEDMTLYAKTEKATWHRSGTIRPKNNLLVGTLTMGVDGFDTTDYQEAPVYVLAVYENGALTAIRKSSDGTFNLTADDNVVYNDGTTTVKAYAWNDSKLIPYINPMNVTFPSNPSGEEGGEESDGGSGDDSGESEGDEGAGGTGGENGDVTPGQE